MKLLAVKDLERYRKKYPNEEDIQEDWSTVIRLPGKYVTLLVGQRTDEDLCKEKYEENYYDDKEWDQVQKNYFLAYHQAKAHVRWCASRPDEAEHLNSFTATAAIPLFFLLRTSLISFPIFVRCQRLIARNVADGFLLFSLADTF